MSKRSCISVLLAVLFLLVFSVGRLQAKTDTSTAIATSLNPSTYGSSVTLAATVTPSSATGTVTFKDGTTTLGKGTISAGQATFSSTKLAVGQHSITASYSGDTNDNSSTSTPLAQKVNQASTTVMLVSAMNPSAFGPSVKFTAMLTPSTATGTVTFMDGSTTLGTGTTSGGKATFSISALTVGAHSITATYGGDVNDTPSVSSPLAQTVNLATTKTVLSSSTNPLSYGSTVTLTALVTPSAVTGTITFKDGNTTLAVITMSAGSAKYSSSTLAVGAHSATAVYSGDTNYATSTSSTLTQTVKKANSSVALASSANPSTLGAPVTFAAVVSPSSATGTVTFKAGSTRLGTATIDNGNAVFSSSMLAAGSHVITAVYGGDSSDNNSTSPQLTQSVKLPSTVTISSLSNPSTYGSLVMFAAVVSPAAATGTVTFIDGGATLGSGTIGGGSVMYSTSALAVGSHSITVLYSGDTNYISSGSTVLTQLVNKAATTVTLASSANPSSYGAVTTFSAMLSSTTATGTVTFKDGTTTLGTTLVNGASATYSSSALSAGTHSISASYSGDANYNNSTSATLTQSINRAMATLTLISSSNPSVYGSTVTFSATLSSTTATGTVTFSDGLTTIGTGTVSDGSASYSTSTLLGGLHPIMASYSGDINFSISTSTALSEVINTTLVSLAITPQRVSFPTGANLQLTATGRYSDGSNQNVGSMATWSSSAPAIATINSTGLATAVAVGQTTVQVTVGSLNASATLGVVSQTLTGGLPTAMGGNTLTVLEDSTVLVAGGYDSNGQSFSSSEIYNSATGSFVATANLNAARSGHTATLLNNGTVLIVGGFTNGDVLASAELYNPATSTFTTTGNLNVARSGHTATMLPSGQVLIVGGADSNSNSLSSAELYDPIAGTFTLTGSLNTARHGDTATLLSNGMVLIAGGGDSSGNVFQSAELYNPATATFSAASNMVAPRASFTATLLNNGLVLMTGGLSSNLNSQTSAELYNPATGTFASTGSLNSPRSFFVATLLSNGTVLVAGGLDTSGNVLGSAELYDPVSTTFTFTSSFVTARYVDTAVLLTNGNVLESGGLDSNFNRLASAEVYQPSTLTPPGLVSIAVSPLDPNILVGATQSFVATGTFSDNSTQTLASVTWNSSSTAVATISNDATNRGTANAVATGSVIMSACTGSVCSSSALTVSGASLVSMALSPQSVTIPLGTSQQFTATGAFSDGSVEDLTATATWSSSSSAATISSSGLATSVLLGNTTIRASTGSINASTVLTVGAPALASLALSPTTATIPYGGSQQYQVIGTYTDGSVSNLTKSTNWFTVPSETISVSSTGLATGVGQGTATITATAGALFAVGNITVQAPAAPSLVAVVVTPNQTSIPVGSSQQFIATGNYSDGSTQDITSTVTWTSSSSAIASVNTFGLATTATQGSTTLSATSGSITGSATISVTPNTLALNTSRYQHSAILLNNGSVLIAGGVSCASVGSCIYLNSAELYNPQSGTITYTGSLAVARSAPAVLLGNGKVLIAGGYSCDSSGNCASLSSAEIYDPNSNTFSAAGNMTSDRYGHTMTLLTNGKVLMAGGETCSSSTSCNALNTAELYDPVAGTFAGTGPLNSARFNATAAVLNSGQVLIAGGFDGRAYPVAAELYDPIAGTFSITGSLNSPRANATANWIEASGNMVLVAGGSTCSSPGCPTAAIEYYQNGYFYSLGSMTTPRLNQTATLLTNGQLFLAGGLDSCVSSCVSDSTSELYNPQTYSFASSQALTTGRSGHTATLLTDGSVLLVGGINNGVTLAGTDSYQPASLALPQLSSIIITPSNNPVAIGSTLPLVADGVYGLGVLQSVIWSSSSPSVASVSNAAGSTGIVSALSAGTTTITASVGTISATAQITVTPVLVSVTVTPTNPLIALNSTQLLQLSAIGNYSDGSSGNLTPYVKWTNSNSSVATLTPNLLGTATQLALIPVGVGSANIAATFGGLSGSTTVNVIAPPMIVAPSIISASPTAGSAGTQVTIAGSGFGSNQGAGTIWLGTILGQVVSWSDGLVIANVSTGSSSGSVQIQQSGVASNAVPFTVNIATISSVTPSNGVAGTQVTITGSGFGMTQGNGMVRLGNVLGVVVSWSDGQVVANVASGAASGTAQILQSGVWSKSIPFTINVPHIASITPNSAAAGTAVTIKGNGFGLSQGSGVVWIGSTDGMVISWSDSQVVASVASGALSGIVKIQQNGTWSNAVTFSVPPSGGTTNSVTLVPNLISMQVGSTHSIQALNASGQTVTDLTWTSSNTSVATLSTDDPPIITGVSVGYTTITAGNASADITVLAGATALQPPGTVVCKNPGDGSGVSRIVPAVPSPSGVADVFALQADGNVLAVTSDCLTAWSANVGTGNSLIPDFQGGLVVANAQSIYKLDGITGQAYPAYTSPSGNSLQTPVLHTDGTIFTVDGDKVVGINPQMGQAKFRVQMDDSISTSISVDDGRDGDTACFSSPLPQGTGSQGPDSSVPNVGNLMIAGDGYAYVPYVFGTVSSITVSNIPDLNQNCTAISASFALESLVLLRVGTRGDSYTMSLGEWGSGSVVGPDGAMSQSAPMPAISMATPITNSDTGVLFTWSVFPQEGSGYLPFCPPGTLIATDCIFENTAVNVATTSSAGVSSRATMNIPGGVLQAVLQRADGSYVGTDGINMFAFTPSGELLWTVPNDTPQIATADGGVIGASAVTYDQNGIADGQLSSLPTYSWLGYSYKSGSVDEVTANSLFLAPSFWAFAQGNASANFTAAPQQWYPPLDTCTATPGCIGHNQAIYNALDDLTARLKDPTLIAGPNGPITIAGLAQTMIFDKLGNDANGNKLTTGGFITYLSGKRPRFYNGLTSTYCKESLDSGESCFHTNLVNTLVRTPLNSYFASNPKTGALTGTPSDPFLSFFNPNEILFNNLGKNLGNESLIFHEALHGLTGLFDSGNILRPMGILEKLGSNPGLPSCYISEIIASDVLSHSAGIDNTEQPCK